MKIILAITGASGAIYGSQILSLLVADDEVERVALIFSPTAREVARWEGVEMECSDKVVEYSPTDLFSPVASGSAGWDGMIIAPCSAGTMSRVAHGISDSLITRAADVMLKERRRLIVVLRETPLSLIHLRNMTSLTEAGAIIMPAAPNFYSGAKDVESLALTVSSRAVEMVGARGGVKRWDGKKNG